MDPELKRILDVIFAYRKSRAVFATVELAVFDALASGPLSVDQLVEKLGTEIAAPEGLTLLLKTCVCLKLLTYTDGLYGLSPLANKFLVSSSADSMSELFKSMSRSDYKVFGALEASVKDEKNPLGEEFDRGIDCDLTDKEAVLFSLKTANGPQRFLGAKTMTAFDLSKYNKIAQLNGGTGAMMVAACEAYDNLSAIVVDRPAVAEVAEEVFSAAPYITSDDVRARVTWCKADLGSDMDQVPSADLYTLSQVLCNWSDNSVASILQSLHSKLQPGGAVLLCEHLLDEDRCGPEFSVMTDVTMLLKKTGKLRTLSEYKTFLEAAGFSESEAKTFPQGWTVILATKL